MEPCLDTFSKDFSDVSSIDVLVEDDSGLCLLTIIRRELCPFVFALDHNSLSLNAFLCFFAFMGLPFFALYITSEGTIAIIITRVSCTSLRL